MKQTSRQAYEEIKDKLTPIRKKVLTSLKVIKKGSFRDIARQSGLADMQVWKRLSELRKDNKVRETGVKRCPVSGRLVTVWEAVE